MEDAPPPSGLPSTFIDFTHHSYAQMVRVLKRTAARCSHVARTYSIGRSFDGKDLLVIELSARPGQHELSKLLWQSGAQEGPRHQPSLGKEAEPAWPRGAPAGGEDSNQSPRCLGYRAGAEAPGLCSVCAVAQPHPNGHVAPLGDIPGSQGAVGRRAQPRNGDCGPGSRGVRGAQRSGPWALDLLLGKRAVSGCSARRPGPGRCGWRPARPL